jgi:hypothetical protein
MAAIYASPFAQGVSDDVRQAAIRAVLRHGVHEDGAHYHTKSLHGLHPVYVSRQLHGYTPGYERPYLYPYPLRVDTHSCGCGSATRVTIFVPAGIPVMGLPAGMVLRG